MGRVRHSAALRYCAAGLACGGALAGGLVLAPLTGNAFVLFLAAVALSTWWGGLGPGLLATLAGTAAIDYFFEQPRYSFEVASTSTLLDLAVFVLMALLLGSLNARAQRALSALQALAQHDSLTGLANRGRFRERLSHALARAERRGRSIAVLFLDLDDFKQVNDKLGHEAGDRLLVQVADRLRHSLREVDTVARLGGDEFTVLLDEPTGPDEAVAAAERVLDALRSPVDIAGHSIVVRASVGIGLSEPGQDDEDGLLRKADLALYQAKAQGPGRCLLFDDHMQAPVRERRELEHELLRAFDQGEFRVHYQPVVGLADARIIGAEALLRWARPGRGLVEPAAFLPATDEIGLLESIGDWLLEEVCRQARLWQERYPSESPLLLSVNLSARQLRRAGLAQRVQQAVRGAGLDPRTLQLEISESTLSHEPTTAATLRELKAVGVRLAIDDFGARHGSLTWLQHLCVDEVKLDRASVRRLGGDERDAALARGVLAAATTLRLGVTAEGVETPEQRWHLLELGCERGQGHLFARPGPAEAFEALFGVQPPIGGFRQAA